MGRLAEVRANIPADSTLVSINRYGGSSGGEPAEAYLALVLDGQGRIDVVPLDTAQAIDGAIGRWRDEMLAQLTATAARESDYEALGSERDRTTTRK